MKTNISHYLVTTVIIASLALVAIATTTDDVPGQTLARMEKLGKELAAPNSNHQILEKLAGEWNTVQKFMGTDPTTGTASYEMIYDNRFLDGTHTGSIFGIAFEGRLTIGYDNYKHKYVITFIDNLGTALRTAEGMLDQSGKVLSFWGTMDEWMTDEHDKPVMYQYKFIDQDTFFFGIHDLSIIDKNSLVIAVTYTRVKTN
ncbi:MAG TPA: DUF1579 domain-containing protein [Phycisphaerales bacterium]|nr:DUF1579 domain-containing protein [Phycisphaerales bacterium]HIB51306.1 DUF1579 domain-containing protein [Phycisphaerales bacterium]HIN83394.1 DUF1579 domain-containing protein [Phycisphaerales bacterium]HIO19797.1 DUF1579 domain-containing protein [Phycisphaerales bacterium]